MKTIDLLPLPVLLFGMIALIACNSGISSTGQEEERGAIEKTEVIIEAEAFNASDTGVEIIQLDSTLSYVKTGSYGWIALDVHIPVAGRYRSSVHLSSGSEASCWIEDYSDNKDDRTYNITGNIQFPGTNGLFVSRGKDGTPLNAGLHKMKLHFNRDVNIDWIKFSLMKAHEKTPVSITQATDGEQWTVVWADEFESALLDTSRWTYDFGDWGWGNNELQYYTRGRTENARIENGNLVIEARKNDMGKAWTSARITTRGKISFLYGKIEFRAKVPAARGNWAAGWTLGDEYVDELSWPYCGEIDILESVGYEMNDTTGNGVAHVSAHSGAYYFKLGNQPTGVIDVENMNNEYHIYAVEWTPEEIRGYVDNRQYITYNDNSTDLSWPFSKPQNIILNLAMGGSWAGYYGIDETVSSQKMIIDYVRVYERK